MNHKLEIHMRKDPGEGITHYRSLPQN